MAFTSGASNLVANDTNATDDVFVRDLQTNITERVSVSDAEAQAQGASFGWSISGNGRFVAFYSGAENLVDGDTNGRFDIFVRDRLAQETHRVSVDSAGVESNGH